MLVVSQECLRLATLAFFLLVRPRAPRLIFRAFLRANQWDLTEYFPETKSSLFFFSPSAWTELTSLEKAFCVWPPLKKIACVILRKVYPDVWTSRGQGTYLHNTHSCKQGISLGQQNAIETSHFCEIWGYWLTTSGWAMELHVKVCADI